MAQPAPGAWHATLARDRASGDCSTIIHEIAVADRQPAPLRPTEGVLWPIRNTWNRGTENLYSAWIEKLFDAPLDAAPSWKALHEVLRDQSRNFLFDHLGLREDRMGLIIRPDCADLPYFLRAYFSFKMGLPFGYSKCTRGGAGQPPRCHSWWNIQNLEPPPKPAQPAEEETADTPLEMIRMPLPAPGDARAAVRPMAALKRLGLAQGFGQYVSRAVADGVHSGSGRTKLTDENTDYYPVPLTEDALRPGTMYADPYGHMLVLAKRVPQTGRRGRRLPRGRRPARRDGRAQALLARQLPVRAGSRARRPRLQALPADRARAERHAAPADQRGDRQEPAIRRLLARAGASSTSRASTTRWTT